MSNTRSTYKSVIISYKKKGIKHGGNSYANKIIKGETKKISNQPELT